MALVVKDRVKQTTTTTGTGSLVLNGTVDTFQTFASALANGDTTYYAILEPSTNAWEVGLGTWTESTTTLARTTILESSNSGSAINLTAGEAEVFITQPAEKAVYYDANGDITPTGDVDIAGTLDVTGAATFDDSVTIQGDLTVQGTTTTVEATNLAIADNMIYLNDGSSVTNPDLGWAGNYNDGTYAHAGIFRDASDGTFKIYDGYTPEPDAATNIDTTHASFTLAPLDTGALSVEGNVTVTGTVDGRDVAADGSKLDGIEAGATGDQSASEILTAVKTVDGSGSGLDADLLDGQQGSYYLDWTHVTNKPDPSVTLSGDVSGTATMTNLGSINITTTVANDSHTHDSRYYTETEVGNFFSGSTAITGYNKSNWDTAYGWGDHASAGYLAASSYTAADVLTKIKTVDGAGSGLDADTLDGISSGSFLRSDANDTYTGLLSFGNTSSRIDGSDGFPLVQVNASRAYFGSTSRSVTTLATNSSTGLKANVSGTDYTVWHQGNDGSGSGLDADLLDGQHGSYYLDWTNTTNKPDPTLTLNGDVSGSATFTNLGNATLTVTVADDSHNHTTANIDNFTESVQDIAGGMWSGNSESGVSVTYQDTDGTLDINVNDPTISLTGAVTGSATMTNLGNVSIATTATSDPTITLTGAVTGSGTMTNLGNVSIATTATADPTLTLTGDVTGSATFTNLGNATLTATVASDSHTHDGRYYTETESNGRYFRRDTSNDVDVRLASGHGRGLRFWDSDNYKIWMSSSTDGTWGGRLDSTSDYNMYFRMSGGTNRGFVFQNGTTEVFQVESGGQTRQTGAAYVNTNQRVFADNYHPNADKWTTARTLSLSGDASGSVSWDGSANATLSVTVADDSHNHVISNVDGLQTALDGKLSTSGTAANSQLLDSLDSSQFLRSDTNDTVATGRQISFYSNDTLETSSSDQASLEVFQDTSGADAFMQFHVGGDYAAYFGLKGDINDFAVGGWSMGNNYYRVWHSGNDGSGSGLDADTLDGLQLNSQNRNNQANAVVRTQANGYAEFGWINTTSGDTTSGLSRIYVDTGDGYIRKSTLAHVASQGGYVTSGSSPSFAGLNINGNLNAVDNIYLANLIYHEGDTNTYLQFHAADQFRVVTGGTERLEVNNSRTQIDTLLTDAAICEDYDALSGTSVTADPDAGGAFSLTMTGNTTFTFGAPALGSGVSTGFIIELTGNGGTVTWPTSVDWAGGTAPDAPASGETDIYVFWTRDGGTTWYGVLSVDAAA
jgi:hypothetical protein